MKVVYSRAWYCDVLVILAVRLLLVECREALPPPLFLHFRYQLHMYTSLVCVLSHTQLPYSVCVCGGGDGCMSTNVQDPHLYMHNVLACTYSVYTCLNQFTYMYM